MLESDDIVKDKITNMIHVHSGFPRAILLDDACWNAHSNTVTGQVCHNDRACTNLAASTHQDGPKHTDARTKQHAMVCRAASQVSKTCHETACDIILKLGGSMPGRWPHCSSAWAKCSPMCGCRIPLPVPLPPRVT